MEIEVRQAVAEQQALPGELADVAVRKTSGPKVSAAPGPMLFGAVHVMVCVPVRAQSGSEKAGRYAEVVAAPTSVHVMETLTFTMFDVEPPLETVTVSVRKWSATVEREACA